MIQHIRTSLFALLSLLCLPLSAQDFAVGADISWSTEQESRGELYKNWNGEPREAFALMKEMGMNAVRLRVWVDPQKHGNWCGKDDVLTKALRAKSLGMDIMIDFHYSDWWADPAKQNIPASWDGMSYKKMRQALAAHTIEVLSLLRDNGVTPRWVQVGNETRNGLLWSVEMDPVTGWEKKDANGNTILTKSMGHIDHHPKQYAGFIGAGYDAVKSVFPEAIVIVHLDNGFDNAMFNRNLDTVLQYGGKFDMIGMSLYPYWAMEADREPNAKATISDCMKNIRLVSKKYGCDVMITETGFLVDDDRPYVMQQGREQYADVLRRAKNETGGRCKGVFYWEPLCNPRQYKLGAFHADRRPTDIMRALKDFMPDITPYDRQRVRIETTAGNMTVELYNETPRHRDNFLRLASSGAFDGMLFHRVIENFMLQSGDPASVTAPPTSIDNPAPELGNSDVLTPDSSKSIAAEIVYPQFFHKRGALAAARESDTDNPELRSSSSQFYIVWGKWPVTKGKNPYVSCLGYYEDYQQPGTPWLDGGYTVFGELTDGWDVAERIQSVETDRNDRPLKDIRILKAVVLNNGH
jgi:arabinogalactan endo-1,4-beta-galactosidase